MGYVQSYPALLSVKSLGGFKMVPYLAECFVIIILKFLILFEQGIPLFSFVLTLAYYVGSPSLSTCVELIKINEQKQ